MFHKVPARLDEALMQAGQPPAVDEFLVARATALDISILRTTLLFQRLTHAGAKIMWHFTDVHALRERRHRPHRDRKMVDGLRPAGQSEHWVYLQGRPTGRAPYRARATTLARLN